MFKTSVLSKLVKQDKEDIYTERGEQRRVESGRRGKEADERNGEKGG